MAGRLIIPNSSLLNEKQGEILGDALNFSSTFAPNVFGLGEVAEPELK
mgnify:CR=1 FL=1